MKKSVTRKILVGLTAEADAALAALMATGLTQTQAVNANLIAREQFNPYVEDLIANHAAARHCTRHEAIESLLSEAAATKALDHEMKAIEQATERTLAQAKISYAKHKQPHSPP